MPLYQRRQKRRQKAEALNRGDTVRLSLELSKETRTRILFCLADASPNWEKQSRGLYNLIRREWGRGSLMGFSTPQYDLFPYIIDAANPEEVLDFVEGWFQTLGAATEYEWIAREAEEHARPDLNEILDDDDVAYQVVGTEIIPRDSMVRHAEVISPALSLLHGTSSLRSVEQAFQDALRELKPGGDPSDAITDAGTALQEMLLALGCTGNALGPLLADAKKRGILGPFDSKLSDGVHLIGEWVSANRSTRGDAHKASAASREDAWLAVHVVGALLIRLEKGPA